MLGSTQLGGLQHVVGRTASPSAAQDLNVLLVRNQSGISTSTHLETHVLGISASHVFVNSRKHHRDAEDTEILSSC